MEIVQRTGLLGDRVKAYVADDYELVLEFRGLLQRHVNRFALDTIDPRWSSHKNIPVVRIAIAIVALVAGVGLAAYGAKFMAPPADGPFWFFGVVLLVVALVVAAKAFKAYANVVSFRLVDGRTLFSLKANSPTREDVEKFCDGLKAKIESIKYSPSLAREQRAQVLRKHAEFLFSEGVLLDEEFKAVTERIDNVTSGKVVRLAASRDS